MNEINKKELSEMDNAEDLPFTSVITWKAWAEI